MAEILSAQYKSVFTTPTHLKQSTPIIKMEDKHRSTRDGNPDIPTIYQAAEPTTQSFLSSMAFGDLQLLDHKEKNIVKWLKKYIKLLKVEKLKLLLLYCTGSNIMQGLKIMVMFFPYDSAKDPNNIMRCPEARTCGPTLRLPNNYRTERELISELNGILQEQSSKWGFDMA